MAMVTAVGGEREMGLEATELRLGLPGGGETGPARNAGKRGFSETVDLKLKLETNTGGPRGRAAGGAEGMKGPPPGQKSLAPLLASDPAKPSAPKAQVVGWPPVRSFRKNIMSSVQAADRGGKDESGASPAAFVKVSMDGAPYLRKVDLKMYRSYQELYVALEKMFSSFTIGNCGSQAMNGRDFMSESKLMDLLNGSDYVPTYEDRDGDWMLVGDVPWEMFVESCKRLRIMKGSEAVGLAPRAMEKCKSRS